MTLLGGKQPLTVGVDREPYVAAITPFTTQAATASYQLTLPADIREGDLLFVYWTVGGNSFGSSVSFVPVATLLGGGGTGALGVVCWLRVCDGTEGGTTSTWTVANSNVANGHAVVVRGGRGLVFAQSRTASAPAPWPAFPDNSGFNTTGTALITGRFGTNRPRSPRLILGYVGATGGTTTYPAALPDNRQTAATSESDRSSFASGYSTAEQFAAGNWSLTVGESANVMAAIV